MKIFFHTLINLECMIRIKKLFIFRSILKSWWGSEVFHKYKKTTKSG